MTHFKRSFFTLLFSSLFFFAFGQSPLQNYIPSDATFVFTMNPNNLNSKVNLRSLKEYDFYNMAMAQMAGSMGGGSEELMNVLADPSTIGMDIMSKSYMFGKISEDIQQFGFLFNLSDESKFVSFIKGMSPDLFEGDKYADLGGYKLLKMDKEGWFAWNNNMAFIGGGEYNLDVDWDDEQSIAQHDENVMEMTADWVTQTMNRNAENAITAHPKFKMATRKPSDMHLWLDYAFISENMNKGFMDGMNQDFGGFDPAIIMGLMKSFYEDTYLSIGMNFDNGKIAFNTETFMNKEMLDLNRSMRTQKFNKKLAKYIRGEELLGYWSTSMNTKSMQDAYKKLIYSKLSEIPMYGDLAQGGLDILSIFLDETALPGLFKGDMVVAVTGMQTIKKTITDYEYDEDFNATEIQKEVEQNIPEVTMVWTHGSKNDWMKFIRLGVKSSFLESAGDYYKVAIPGAGFDAYVALKDDMLFISNSTDLVTNRLAKGYKKKQRISKDHCKRMSENAMAIYWDIPNTLSILGSNPNIGQFTNIGKQNFESVTVTSSRTVGNSTQGEFNINFVKKDENSLKQIFEIINKMFLDMMGGENT